MINTSFIQKNFPKGKVTVVHGRPATGKTSLGVSMALCLAKENRCPMYFSMEMSKEKLIERFSAQAGAELPADVLNNIFINDAPALHVCDIRKALEEANADFVIIDYLQLMEGEGCNSRSEELQRIKEELNVIATETNIPVVVLSQLSRSQVEDFNNITEFPDHEDDFEQEEDKDAYTIDEDGNVTITDSEWGVRNCLFRKRTDVKSIYVPDSVDEIGILAFNECPNLKIVRVKNLQMLKATGLGEHVIVATNPK